MQATSESVPPGHRPGAHLPGLDGLRGVAILVVLCHHFVTPNYPEGIPAGLHGTVVRVFYRLCDVGWWGVDLFFVLSGFLITGILLDAKGSAHYFRNFYARRGLRIFPLYYGVLLTLFVVLPTLARLPAVHDALEGSHAYAFSQGIAPKQAWLWLYGTNIKTAIDATGWTFGYLTHFWSLAVEEHFYLVWPLVVWACGTRTLVKVCVAVAAASIFARGVCLAAGMAPAYIFVLTPCRLDGLAFGGLVAAWSRLPGGEGAMRTLAARVLRFAGPITLLALLTLPRFGAPMVLAGHFLLALACATALPFAATAGAGSWVRAPALRWLGKYSYGLYVLHPFVLEPMDALARSALVRKILGISYEAYAFPRMTLALVGACAAAWLSWHLYEKHFLRLKAFFPNGNAAAATPVAAAAMVPGAVPTP